MSFGIVSPAGAPRARDFRGPVDVGPASHSRELSEDEIFSLVRDIDRDGYAVLPRYIQYPDIAILRRFVSNAVAAAGNRYTALGPAPVAETMLGKMASS